MLSGIVEEWSLGRLAALIASGKVDEDAAQKTAIFIADKPSLWTVSDDDFVSAVFAVDPLCAALLASPQGIEFLHRMSRAIALRGAVIRVKGIFGG